MKLSGVKLVNERRIMPINWFAFFAWVAMWSVKFRSVSVRIPRSFSRFEDAIGVFVEHNYCISCLLVFLTT